MSTRDYTANVISATPVVPDGNFKDSKASGVWDINEALDLIKGGNWPNAANLNPAAFVDGLFQTHLYTGTGSSAQTITNNIDLTKGGLVWVKHRSLSASHILTDSERGVQYLRSDTNDAQINQSLITNFVSTGFTANGDSVNYANDNGEDYVSWTFRKQPKFFDIVTYTGNGSSSQTISHSLGSVPGMIIVKRYDGTSTEGWEVYHRGVSFNAGNRLFLNLTNAVAVGSGAFASAPTSTEFYVGPDSGTNASSGSYIAYLFAHNADSTDSVQTSLQGKTLSNLGSAFDGSYPITEINDGVAETNNANSIGYVSNADMDISVDYGSAVVANAYYIAPQGDQGGSVYNTPTAFTAYGSNDGSSWTSLASFSSISGFAAGSFKEFTFSNTTAYRYYRLEITASSASGVSISEWELGLKPDASEVGDFGEAGDSNIIKCGGYTGNGSTDGTEVNLGFEPQWLMIKATSVARDWHIFDAIRGTVVGGNDSLLQANLSDAESSGTEFVSFTPTGFKLNSTDNKVNGNNHTYIFMAIRRGGMQTPTSASDVFGVNYTYTYDVNGATGGSSAQLIGYIGEPADLNMQGYRSGSSFNATVYDRLRNNKYFITNSNPAEASVSGKFWDNMAGFREVASAQDTTMISWTWKRARGYFDMVAYSGTGSARTVSHNLGAVPEMIWVKRRDSGGSWGVWHKDLTSGYYLSINTSDAEGSNSNVFTTTDPTATQFSVGSQGFTNNSGGTFMAYLFATVTGVSKVGSYSGNGGSQTIDCGFSGGTGARFVLIKRTDQAADWKVYDTVRGIVAGNDPELALNSNAAEVTGYDYIDPHSSGFIIPVDNFNTNASGGSYIFYAIA